MQKIDFVCVFIFLLNAKLQVLELEFCHSKLDRTTDKLEINRKNFAQVELQLKFASEYGFESAV